MSEKGSGNPPRADLEAMRKAGKSRDEIATFYGVSLARVKRWIRQMKIETAMEPRTTHANARRRAEKQVSMDAGGDDLTLMEKMHIILGRRLEEDWRGYLLDGRPARLDVLAKAAGITIPEVNR